jgi:uncharacterized protein YndB with AHSA1/START domain
MTERSVHHASFTIERVYDASPAQVFKAWADPSVKRRWFGSADELGGAALQLEFRVGGRETISGGPPAGAVYSYRALYQDIVPDQRIVYTYDMDADGTRISVSLSTVQFTPDGASTRMTYTEQGAFLDGLDTAAVREQGTRELFDALARELRREPVST